MSQSNDRQFLELYQKHRYGDQIHFYQKRERAFTKAQRQMIFICTGLMFLTALAGALEAIDISWLKITFMFIAAISPVLYTTFTAYNTLYAFEQQAKLYRDTLTKLQFTQVLMPDITQGEDDIAVANQLNKYIEEVENIFLVEQGHWGQLATRMKPDG